MEKFYEFLSSDAFYPLIVGLFTLIYGGIKAKYFMFDAPKDAKKKRLIELGEEAVKETFDELVRELKRAKGNDGKLSKEEIAQANKMAVDKLKEKAKANGMEAAKIIAETYLPVFIDKIVNNKKKKVNG